MDYSEMKMEVEKYRNKNDCLITNVTMFEYSDKTQWRYIEIFKILTIKMLYSICNKYKEMIR